jgi:hypothetical protein
MEFRIENIVPMATAADPVVNDQLKDNASSVMNAGRNILPTSRLPLSVTLNPLLHRAPVRASVPRNAILSQISCVVQSGTKQTLAPL